MLASATSTWIRAGGRYAAGAITCGLIVVLAIMGSELLSKLGTLRAAPRDNIQWGLAQVQNEYTRFHLAVAEAKLLGEAGRKDVTQRFDILYSRFNILQRAPIYANLRKDKAFAERLAVCRNRMDALAAIIDAKDTSFAGQLPSLHAITESFEADVQALVLDAVVKFAAISDEERSDLSRFVQNMGLAALALVVILLLVITLLYLQEKTLRKREAALLESRNRMAATSQVSLDAVVVSDRHGKIIDYNDAAAQCFGYSKEETLGADMAQLLIPDRHREGHRLGMQRYLSSGQTKVIGRRIEIEALHADGHEIPVELALGVSQTSDGPIFIAFLRDITQRRQNDAELRRAIESATEGARAKESFLANMSHEIRTPLNGVIGVMDLLRQTELSASQSHYVEIARQSGEALLSLISDILDVSKMNASGVELHPGTLLLEDLIRNTVETTSIGAAANGNFVNIGIGEDVPKAVTGDADRLRQVIFNLLSNAQKFTKGGEITVSLKRAGGSDACPMLEFSVTDSGIGFDRQQAGNLFKEFSTLDASYQRQNGGTGLGLAISKRIIEAMQGEIGAESQLREGSRFWFRVSLPVAEMATADTGQPDTLQQPQQPLYILIAEDNPTNLLVTRNMLVTAGHRVDEAQNGLEAVTYAKLRSYDLILMDMSMPGMDGLEATRLIRKMLAPAGRTPIIALTANAMQEDAEQAIAAGMDGFLSKPIRKTELISRIAAIMKERAPAMTSSAFDESIYSELCADLSEDGAQQVLRSFMQELVSRHQELLAAFSRGDTRDYGRLCHAIAGSAATVGAAGLAGLTREIEGLCKAGEADAAMARRRDLDAAIAEAQDAISFRAAAPLSKIASNGIGRVHADTTEADW